MPSRLVSTPFTRNSSCVPVPLRGREHLPRPVALRRGAAVDWQRMQSKARGGPRPGGLRPRRAPPRGQLFHCRAASSGTRRRRCTRTRGSSCWTSPRSTLPLPDVGRLFTVLRALSEQGVTLLYISHRMDELFSLCDAVTVLRDGVNAADLKTADSKPADVVTAMVGKDLEGSIADAALRGERSPRLGPGPRERVSFPPATSPSTGPWTRSRSSLREGEVLGISGLIGSGQSELAAS